MRGGLFRLALGGRFLLRPGGYTVIAEKSGYHELDHPILGPGQGTRAPPVVIQVERGTRLLQCASLLAERDFLLEDLHHVQDYGWRQTAALGARSRAAPRSAGADELFRPAIESIGPELGDDHGLAISEILHRPGDLPELANDVRLLHLGEDRLELPLSDSLEVRSQVRLNEAHVVRVDDLTSGELARMLVASRRDLTRTDPEGPGQAVAEVANDLELPSGSSLEAFDERAALEVVENALQLIGDLSEQDKVLNTLRAQA